MQLDPTAVSIAAIVCGACVLIVAVLMIGLITISRRR